MEKPKMMPGQEPYTEQELGALYALIADAAAEDSGEESENNFLALEVKTN